MNLVYAMSIYFLLFLIIFIISEKMGKTLLSSFLLAMIICLFFIYVIYPPCNVDERSENSICVILYSSVIILTFVTCIFVSLYGAIIEKSDKNKN